jgi:3'(2'), 5'-bisphosphate nucleotidase
MVLIHIGELVSVCVDLAEQAGATIKQVHSSGQLKIQIKGYSETGVEDPLTEADTKAQVVIVDGLLSKWPALKIVAEEDRVDNKPPATKPRTDRIDLSKVPVKLRYVPLADVEVFIDPLDATREFTKGFVECVMTLIGITVKGVPTAGVMYQPFVKSGVTMYGIVGAGVWGVDDAAPHKGIVAATTASHSNAKVEAALEQLKPDKIMRVGGAGYKALLVIEGTADVYIFPTEGCKLWDTCAPHALLLAAGGTMTDATGGEIIYGSTVDVHVRKGVLASMRDHGKYVSVLNKK